jgi:tetratricopeptide (TPR) repeat protein
MGIVGKWFSFGKNEHYDAGIRHYEAGEYGLAVEQFKICLSSDPDVSTRERARSYLAGSLGKLARAAALAGDHSGALEHLDEAISYRPAFADLRMLRSQVFDALGKAEDRAFEIRFSLDINPRYGLAVLHDGILEIEKGDSKVGRERLEEAVAADPRLDTETYREAVAKLEAGDDEGAVEMLKKVAANPKSDPESTVRNADKLAQEGRWADAEEAYRRALDISPRYADVRCKHGQVLLQMDEVEQAIAEFREAVTINPRYADGYAMLGIAYRRAGQNEEAREAFRAALEIDPNHIVASVEIERP